MFTDVYIQLSYSILLFTFIFTFIFMNLNLWTLNGLECLLMYIQLLYSTFTLYAISI